MRMKQIQLVVVHYVLNILNYSIKSMELERMLSNLIFSAKIVSGKQTDSYEIRLVESSDFMKFLLVEI